MRDKLYSIIKIIISSLCFFFIGSVGSLILKIFGFNINNASNIAMINFQFVISLIMFIILIILYFKDIKKDYKLFKEDIKKNIGIIIKLFLIFMIVKYIVSFITVLIATLLELDMNTMTSENQNLIETYIKAAPFIMAISTALFAPVYEELLFRLGFKKVLGKNILFIIISGFVFGLLHVFPLEEGVTLTLGIIQSISYITMGIFLAYIYKKTDNIFISIGVHFFNNFVSVLTMINMF